VGIDIAKDKHHAFFGTAYGRTLWRRLIFTNDFIGYLRLVEQTELLLKQHRLKEVVFGLEPTGNYHKPLACWLIQHNYLVVLVAGKAVKDNRELLDGRWDKNDTKDSANAADLVSQGKCQFYEQPDSVVIALRNLLVVRKELKKEEHKLRMRIRNGLIVKYFPELDRHWGSCLEENLAIVRWYLDPHKIADTDFNQFVRHVTTTDQIARSASVIFNVRPSSFLALNPSVIESALNVRVRTDKPQCCIKKMEKTSPNVMCAESTATPGRISGINQQCSSGSVRFFSIFFTLRESLRRPAFVLSRDRSNPLRLHPLLTRRLKTSDFCNNGVNVTIRSIVRRWKRTADTFAFMVRLGTFSGEFSIFQILCAKKFCSYQEYRMS
jgi:transposase